MASAIPGREADAVQVSRNIDFGSFELIVEQTLKALIEDTANGRSIPKASGK
jgi:hypothetical protein